MSKIKEFYFEEINRINEIDDMVDEEYMYQLWLGKIEEDKFLEIYFEENKERFESEKIFGLTNTYPF
jgi:hypothetical protein